MAQKIPLGLYPILNLDNDNFSHILALHHICIEENIGLIQLRYKQNCRQYFTDCAMQLVELSNRFKSQIIINDRVDIAILSHAHGVHLGQNDIDVKIARSLLPGGVIGLSTHSLEQVKNANETNIDYIGFGPIFTSKTKENLKQNLGITVLENALQISKLPIIAIGGINLDNIKQLKDVRIQHVAVIAALQNAQNPREFIKQMGLELTDT